MRGFVIFPLSIINLSSSMLTFSKGFSVFFSFTVPGELQFRNIQKILRITDETDDEYSMFLSAPSVLLIMNAGLK